MKINRIGNQKELNQEVQRIEIEIAGIRYTITEYFGEMNIHCHGDGLSVIPRCGNEICVKGSHL